MQKLMYNDQQIKLAALKLCQLKTRDQKWVLKQLPEKFSAKVGIEIGILKKLGVVNSSELALEIENKVHQRGLDEQLKLIKNNFSSLNGVDRFLICQTLDDEAKNAFCNEFISVKNQDVSAEKDPSSSILSDKFKRLYYRSLTEQLGVMK